MKIGIKEKIGYGLGDMSSSMFWKLFGMYLLYFYTDVFGISAAAVGTMFLITRIWDSLNDPIMGIVSDRTQTRWGKFRPYILWMALPFGLIGTLTFTTPSGWTELNKLIYAYVTYTLMMMIYTGINVPYASLLGVMTSDPKQRTILSSYRMFFAYLGSFVALMMIEPLISYFTSLNGITLSEGWTYAVSVIAVICVFLFFGCFYLTRERVKAKQENNNSLKEDLKDLLMNKPWWILLGAGISALIFNSIRDGATIYYFKYFVQRTDNITFLDTGFAFTFSSLYLMLGQASNILGVSLAAPLASVFGKKNTYMFSMLIATILSVAFFFLKPDQLIGIFILQALISICAGSIFPLLWSMYADIADYSELKTGRRATGLIFSSSSMSQKFGWTIGGALTGWLLAIFGFQANVVQNESAITGIRLMLSLLPAIGTLSSVILISFYPLSEKKMSSVVQELEDVRNRELKKAYSA